MKISKEAVAALSAGELHALWEYTTLELQARGVLEGATIAQWRTGINPMRVALGRIAREVVNAAVGPG